jgi:predicted Zn-dependent peptidase
MSARLHRLPNGLTVAVEPMAGIETVAIGLYADAGARSEPAGLSGLAHMVEHMVFKGAGGRSAKGIAEAIEDRGGSLNAWTARDHTVFQARLLADDLELGARIIADLARSPDLDADELERERSVVLSELGEARDTPDDIIFDHLQGAAFPGQPLGLPVLGDEATIAAIDVPAMRAWIEGQYKPDGLVLCAAGKVDEDVVLRLAESLFGDMAPGAAPGPPPARFSGGTHHDRRRFDQLHVAIGFEGLGHRHPDLHALSLYSSAAGGGMSSRLFQQVREERGLAYSIYSWAQPYAETGLFGVYCAAARGDAGRALELTRRILVETAEDLTQAELDRARAQAKAGLLMGLESVATRADHLARSIQIHGRIVPVAESVAELDAVSVAQARAAGARALASGEALATVGGKMAKAA